MFFPTKALGLVGLLVGDALAVPASMLNKRQDGIDSFIDTETPIAYAGVLANIGDDGSKVAGAAAGVVVASPSKSSPDCGYPDFRFHFRFSRAFEMPFLVIFAETKCRFLHLDA